jgi:hypothetical protein
MFFSIRLLLNDFINMKSLIDPQVCLEYQIRNEGVIRFHTDTMDHFGIVIYGQINNGN